MLTSLQESFCVSISECHNQFQGGDLISENINLKLNRKY